MIYPELPPEPVRAHGVEFMHEGVHYVYVDVARYAEAGTCRKCPFYKHNCSWQCSSLDLAISSASLYILPFTDWQLIQLAN